MDLIEIYIIVCFVKIYIYIYENFYRIEIIKCFK